MRPRTTLRQAAPRLLVIGTGLWLVGSCQRAEIDLASLLGPVGGVGGVVAGQGGMLPSSQGGGDAMSGAGFGGDESSIDLPRGGGGGSTAVGGTGRGGATARGGAGGGDAGAGGAVGGDTGAGGGPAPCAFAIYESWDAKIGSTDSEWTVAFGDPSIDVDNHRLVLSYDDVAEREKEYEGSYYVTTTVTLAGGTVLTPYPYSNEGPFPSLRRSADGSAIELGRTKYGQTEVWSSAGWPTLGVSVPVPGTATVQLATYVKAGARAIASKVSYGNVVYRSEWVSGFVWPRTNLGILRYVGQNNSVVFFQQEKVYVGPLSGCEKLSDTAVEELYED